MIKKILLGLIGIYQRHISPHTQPRCRFQPTCSSYAREAIETHGSLKGSGYALIRILRCGPWTRPGYDPVPPRKPACACQEKDKSQ